MTTPLHEIGSIVLDALNARDGQGFSVEAGDGVSYALSYDGPGGEAALPDDIADYDMVLAQEPAWTGAHRLVVRSPSTVLDLMWNDDEPLRIFSWCRGDWETALRETLS